MRHKTATALLGAGAFCLALAVLVPTAVAPSLQKAPADIDLTTESRSPALRLNIATSMLERTEVALVRTLTTHALSDDEYAGDGDTAVYRELINLAVVGPDGDLQTVDARGRYSGLRASEAVVAFDRKTGEGVPGFEGDTYNTTAQTVKFPFGTEQTTYEYYDQTSGQAWPVDFVRTTEVDGLEVYEFQGTVPEVSLGQYGVLDGTDTLYSNTGRTVLVEPVTGSIVSSTTSPQISIRFEDGQVSKALTVEELVPTEATVADRVADAKSSKRSALLLQRAPWVLGLLGLLLLIGGLAATLRRREQGGHVAGDADRPNLDGMLASPRSEQVPQTPQVSP